MALISCPECGKQISDKAKACPDCGFPINDSNTPNETFAVVITSFEQGLLKYNKTFKICKEISDATFTPYEAIEEAIYEDASKLKPTPFTAFTGLSKPNAEWIIKILHKYGATAYTTDDDSDPDNRLNNAISRLTCNKLVCPHCGSTNVVTGAKGASWTRGLIGASKTVNRCGKCGYTWSPKR